MVIVIIRIIILRMDFLTHLAWECSGRKRGIKNRFHLLWGKNQCTEKWQAIVKKSWDYLCLSFKYSGCLFSLYSLVSDTGHEGREYSMGLTVLPSSPSPLTRGRRKGTCSLPSLNSLGSQVWKHFSLGGKRHSMPFTNRNCCLLPCRQWQS